MAEHERPEHERPEHERRDEDEPEHVTLDGPPWGDYVDPDLAYIRGQIGALGSGALGGRSCASLGGFLEVDPDDTAEILAEVRRILRARAERRAAEHAARPDPPAGAR